MEGAWLSEISRQTFAFGRGGIYGLDLALVKQYVDKIRKFLNEKKNKKK